MGTGAHATADGAPRHANAQHRAHGASMGTGARATADGASRHANAQCRAHGAQQGLVPVLLTMG